MYFSLHGMCMLWWMVDFYLHMFEISDSKSWQIMAFYVNQLFACDEILSKTCL